MLWPFGHSEGRVIFNDNPKDIRVAGVVMLVDAIANSELVKSRLITGGKPKDDETSQD